LAELHRVYSGFTEGFDFPVLIGARKTLQAKGVDLPTRAPARPAAG
jgi:hypothetical protein